MRIKIILYVIAFTYFSLIFIINAKEKPRIDFIFIKFKISLVIIFLASILLGIGMGFFFFSKKIHKLKKKIKTLQAGNEIKNK